MSASSVSVRKIRAAFRSEWVLAALVSFCVAMAVVTPFFFLGTASGHDVAFHMASWPRYNGAMEARRAFPALDGMVQFRFRGTAIHFLSAAVVLSARFLGS